MEKAKAAHQILSQSLQSLHLCFDFDMMPWERILYFGVSMRRLYLLKIEICDGPQHLHVIDLSDSFSIESDVSQFQEFLHSVRGSKQK